MLFYLFTDTFKVPSPGLYSPEKVHPQGERHAPQYSISARTKMRRIDPNPAPNQYTLPPIIGSKQPNKPAAPAYVMTNRTEVLYSDQKCLIYMMYNCFLLYYNYIIFYISNYIFKYFIHVIFEGNLRNLTVTFFNYMYVKILWKLRYFLRGYCLVTPLTKSIQLCEALFAAVL